MQRAFCLTIWICILAFTAAEGSGELAEELDSEVVKEVLKHLDHDDGQSPQLEEQPRQAGAQLARINDSMASGHSATLVDLNREIEEVLLSLIIERNRRLHKKRIEELLNMLNSDALRSTQSPSPPEEDKIVNILTSDNSTADCDNVEDVFFPTNEPIIITAIQNVKLNGLSVTEATKQRVVKHGPFVFQGMKESLFQGTKKSHRRPRHHSRRNSKAIKRTAKINRLRARVRKPRMAQIDQAAYFAKLKESQKKGPPFSLVASSEPHFAIRQLSYALRSRFLHQFWDSRQHRLAAAQALINDTLAKREVAPVAEQLKQLQLGHWGTLSQFLEC